MKKIFQWAMAVALIFGLTTVTSCSKSDDDIQSPVVQPDDNGANSGSYEIGYIKRSWNGSEVVSETVVVRPQGCLNNINEDMTQNERTLSGTWYVTGSHEIEEIILVKGGNTLDIVLCDGATLSMGNIFLAGEGSLVRIFCQEKGTGKLVIDPEEGGPAIGPGGAAGGSIEIHGGNITAKGWNGSPAIGSYGLSKTNYYSMRSIAIYGGTLNLTGGDGAAAIGGPQSTGECPRIDIYGGDITAIGGDRLLAGTMGGGAGIGGGMGTALSVLNIYGGTINASGGTDAAGIGAGESAANGEGIINIYGGTITAQGADYAAGIGGGDGRRLNQINIHSGTVYAFSGKNGAGIGGGEGGESGDITITGGTIRAYAYRYANGQNNSGYGAGIGSGQAASVNTIIIKGGDVEAYGGEDGAGIGTGEEYGSDINSGTIEIHGGKVWAEGKGYGAGIGCGEDATFGVLGISGGRVDAHAGSDCGPWSGGIGAYHKDHGADDNCHIGWAGWQRIYIGKGMRLWTYSPNVGYVENVTNNQPWWNYVHQRPQVAFGECDHPGYTEATCPFCYRETLQLQ